MIIIYVPCSNEQEAQLIAQELLQKKLVACANLVPFTSMYWWENTINTDQEVALLLKSVEKHQEAITEAITQLHSYEIPCIISAKVSCNKAFQQYLDKHVI